MKRIQILTYCLLSSLSVCYGTMSFDNPVFYRAPLFQGVPQHDLQDWKTSVEVRYARGSSTDSRNASGKKNPLMNLYGPLDLVPLGVNVESGRTTKSYWEKATPPGHPAANFYSYLPNRKGLDGTVDLHGRLKVEEFDVTVRQGLFSGFFVQADLPVRRVSLDKVQLKRMGNNDLSGNVTHTHHLNVDAFLAPAGDFIKILDENGFNLPKDNAGQSILPTGYRKTAAPEAVISAGWQAENSTILNYFEGVRGSVKAGAILPLGSKRDEDNLLAFPIGFNQSIGFMASVQAELDVWDFFVVGAQAGVRLFMSQERVIRLRTDERQQGWLALQKGRVNIDRGSVWDLSGYVKAEEIIYGLSVAAGFSFVKQEQTLLSLRDDEVLKSFVADEKANNRLVSRDRIVNTDKRYGAWDMQTIHLYVEYDGKVHTDSAFAPAVSCAYSYPLAGRQVIMTEMLSGSARLSMVWDF